MPEQSLQASACSIIESEEVQFNNGPTFSDNGTFYIPHPADVDSFSNPGRVVDIAWQDLVWGEYFLAELPRKC
jgi:hypothetical protein